MNGSVSAQPAGIDDWGPAVINRPFSVGDYLYTDQSAVAELVTDVARMRMGQYTNFGVLNLTDSVLQLKVTEGDMYFRVHDVPPDQVLEIDTPNAAISLLRAGTYRIHVDPNQNTSFVVVRDGQAEVTGGGQAFTLNPGNSASLAGTDQLSYDVEAAPAPDQFDSWCSNRDRVYERVQPRWVPPSMVGYEDLEGNGDWDDSPEYGHVWYPRSVAAGWAPYHDGHWAWVEPWGWTWVDDASWGFAPFHYGRWVYYHERWGWTPGPGVVGYGGPVVRPCYAPALVAWFGGAHFGVSIAIGGGAPSVGWVPLGFGEVYTPSYHVSQNYFRTVNVSNTRIVNTTNITNVYNNVYVNKTVYNTTYVNTRSPNAVMAMPQNSFANGQPVAQQAVALRPQQIAHIQPGQSQVTAPPVAPSRQAALSSLGSTAAHPPAQLMQRQVVARSTPPPPPASFQARQSYLQQHAGQPVNIAQMHSAVAPAAQSRPAVAVVHAPAAQPRVVQAGAHVGNVPPSPGNSNRGPANAAPGNRPVTPPVTPAGTPPAQQPGYPPESAPTAANRNLPAPAAPQNRVGPTATNPSPNVHGLPPNQRQNVPAPRATPPEAPVQPRATPPRTAEPRSNEARPAGTPPPPAHTAPPEHPAAAPHASEPPKTATHPAPPAAHGTPPKQNEHKAKPEHDTKPEH